jgi:hypothetical protein
MSSARNPKKPLGIGARASAAAPTRFAFTAPYFNRAARMLTENSSSTYSASVPHMRHWNRYTFACVADRPSPRSSFMVPVFAITSAMPVSVRWHPTGPAP